MISKKNSFFKTIEEITILFFLLINPGRSFLGKKLNFNWGIIWDIISPLFLVAGWSILMELGIRGKNFDLSYFAFILVFWFGFSQSVTKLININIPKPLQVKKGLNILNIMIANFLSSVIQIFFRMLITLFFLHSLSFNISLFTIFYAFFLISLFSFSYGIIFSYFFRNNLFLRDAHNLFLQFLFLSSSVIIPVSILPEQIRMFLLYNPLVHLFEWMKISTSGIYLDYIYLEYFLIFLLVILSFTPIFLWMMNKEKNCWLRG